MCGETVAVLPEDAVDEGRSPRVRGNRIDGGPALSRRRSIPACAGKPELFEIHEVKGQVDPRVCGETGTRCVLPWARSGRSPRVRGNRVGVAVELSVRGSIPACAGKP